MNRKLALIIGFVSFFLLVIVAPLIIGTIIGNKSTDNVPKQVKTEDKQILKFWNLYDDENVFSGPFQAFFSTHQEYKIDYLSFKNEEEYYKTLYKATAEGWGPDIFVVRGNSIKSFKDMISPIPSGQYGFTVENIKSDFVPVVNSQVLIKNNGQDAIYGVPLYVDSLALYYNKRHYQDFLPTLGKPANLWIDIIAQTKILNQSDNSFERFARNGIALGRTDNISIFSDVISLLLLQLNAKAYSDDYSNTIFSSYTEKDPESGNTFIPSQRAFDFYTSFAKPSSDYYSWNDLITKKYTPKNEISTFAIGKTSTIIGNSQTYQQILKSIQDLKNTGFTIQESNIGISEIPQFSDKVKDTLAISYPLVVSKSSSSKDISYKLISYLSEDNSLRNYLDTTNRPPSKLNLIQEYSQKEPLGTFALQAGYAKNYEILNWSSFSNTLKIVISDLLNQYISLQDAVTNINNALSCDLGVYKKDNSKITTGC